MARGPPCRKPGSNTRADEAFMPEGVTDCRTLVLAGATIEQPGDASPRLRAAPGERRRNRRRGHPEAAATMATDIEGGDRRACRVLLRPERGRPGREAPRLPARGQKVLVITDASMHRACPTPAPDISRLAVDAGVRVTALASPSAVHRPSPSPACPATGSASRSSCPARPTTGRSSWRSWPTRSARWCSSRRPANWRPRC